MSVLGPVLYTCFERIKTTSPSRQNIAQHTHLSLQEVQIFDVPRGFMEIVNPKFARSNSKIEITKTHNIYFLLT